MPRDYTKRCPKCTSLMFYYFDRHFHRCERCGEVVHEILNA